jgi:hypothetical protein
MVNKEHVAAIMAWYCGGRGPRNAYEKDCERPAWREETSAMLHAENAASVNFRYSLMDGREIGHVFTLADFRRVRALEPIEVVKACHCLAYQSCEHPAWETCEAKKMLERIEAAAVRLIPGYAEAYWELVPLPVESERRAHVIAVVRR